MTQEAKNNAKVLYQLSVDRSLVDEAMEIYRATPLVKDVFGCPVVTVAQKQNLVEKLWTEEKFPKVFINFLKVMCEHDEMSALDEIAKAYYDYCDFKQGIIRADVCYAVKPEQAELDKVQSFLEKKYPGTSIMINEEVNPELLGGLVIHIGQDEYDFSYEGRLRQLERKLTGR